MKLASDLRRTVMAMLAATLCVTAAACTDAAPTAPSGTAPFGQTDLRVGTGAAAANGNNLVVNYTGWLYDETKPDQKGIQFETSAGRGTLSFTLGVGNVIPGWDRGLVGLRVGGLRRLVIPPSLAYGDQRRGTIPAHATLLFEVELVQIVTAASGS